MPYARTNWTIHEVKIALANPVSTTSGPRAHSAMHAVAGELANHPLFQKARVTAEIVTGGATHKNDHFHARDPNGGFMKKADGTNLHSNATRKNNPIPMPDASRHSALNVESMAPALVNALNYPTMQDHLKTLDAGTDMKIHVNFAATIGRGNLHETGQPSISVDFFSLFVYCKINPNNKDVPIFQTVVPSNQLKVGGSDPIITV